jgi:hypothetical protein
MKLHGLPVVRLLLGLLKQVAQPDFYPFVISQRVFEVVSKIAKLLFVSTGSGFVAEYISETFYKVYRLMANGVPPIKRPYHRVWTPAFC